MRGIGTFEIQIQVRLNADVTPEEAREFIRGMCYTIEDSTGKVSIESTEVVGDDISERAYSNELADDEARLDGIPCSYCNEGALRCSCGTFGVQGED